MNAFRFQVNLFALFLLYACSGNTGEGTLALKARLPDDIRLVAQSGGYRKQAVDRDVAIDTIRVSVKDGTQLVSLREFAAIEREGWLTSLPAGEYHVSVEGLIGGSALLRGTKTGVKIVFGEITDAGEFRLAPIRPAAPTQMMFAAPLTNQANLTLAGAKEMFTGISVNGEPVLEVDDAKIFTVRHVLQEGSNTLDVAEHNAEGSMGEAVRLRIVLDTVAPDPLSLTGAASGGSVIFALLAEGAQDMLLSDNPEFSGASWQPYAETASLVFTGTASALTYYVKFRDAAGNESGALSVVVLLDVTPPVVVAGTDKLAKAMFLQNAAVTGAASYQWTQQSGPGTASFGSPTSEDTSIAANSDGVYTVRLTAIDAAGNSAFDEVTFTWDTQGPSAPGTPSFSANPVNSPVTISWAPSTDAGSGLKDYVLTESTDFGATWFAVATTTSASIVWAPSDGQYLYKVKARDRVVNPSVYSAFSAALTVDTTPPAVSLFAVVGTPGAVNTAMVSLDLTASDLSGMEMRFSEDPLLVGASWIPYSTPSTFTLTAGDGAKTIYAEIRDIAGNVAAIVNTGVLLDQTLPSTDVLQPELNNHYNSLLVSASGTATDGTGSGLASVEATLKAVSSGMYWNGAAFAAVSPVWVPVSGTSSWTWSFPVLSDGDYVLETRAGDAAGNLESPPNQVAFTLNNVPPSAPGTPNFAANPVSDAVALSWTASTDDLSAIAGYEIDRSPDGSTWSFLDATSATVYAYAETEGSYYFRIRAHDASGNYSVYSAASSPLVVDFTAPGSPFVVVTGAPAEVSAASIMLDLSAVGATEMQVSESSVFSGAAWVTYSTTTPFILTVIEGTHFIYARFRDGAGNISTAASTSVVLATIKITSLSVNNGFGGDVVTLSGFGFGAIQNTSVVSFGAVTATVQAWSDSSVAVFVPNAAGASVHAVTVTVAGNTSTGWSFTVKPQITSFSAASGIGEDVINIYGTNFGASQGTGYVDLYGARYSIVSWSNAQIDFRLPSDTEAGAWGISVVSDSGLSTTFEPFTLLPFIYSVVPSVATVGTLVTVTGSNLGFSYSLRDLQLGGVSEVEDFWFPTAVTFTVPAGKPAGIADVEISINSLLTGLVPFTVKPYVSSVTPATSGSGGDTVYISGTSFGAGGSLTLGGASAFEDIWTDTLITLTLSNNAEPGLQNFVVTRLGEQSNVVGFTVLPRINSMSAVTRPAGLALVLSGVNFGGVQGISSVSLGAYPATVTSWSTTWIGLEIPFTTPAGDHNVVVTAGGQTSNALSLRVTHPTKIVVGSTPGSSTAGACSGAVQILLQDQYGNAAPATENTNVALGTTGGPVNYYVDAACFTGTGTQKPIYQGFSMEVIYYKGTAAGAFTLDLTAPGLTGASSNEAILAGSPIKLALQGPEFILQGTCAALTVQSQDNYGNPSNVTGTTSVILGGGGAGVYQGTCGGVGISNVLINGGASSAAYFFQSAIPGSLTLTATDAVAALLAASKPFMVIDGTPYIASISPTAGVPETPITIHGQNFGASQAAGDLVYFGDTSAAVTFWSATTIAVNAPPDAAPGAVSVAVLAGGTYSNRVSFEHYRPWIDKRSPIEGTTSTLLTLAGRYFGAAQGTVLVDGITATVQSWYSNAVTVQVPGGINKGVVDVHVETNAMLAANDVPYTQRGSDVWLPFDQEVPEARARHTAVWTGSEMIVWGGRTGRNLNTGGRYNPATDSWVATAVAPILGRYNHTAVWTGKEMIVWGGIDYNTLPTNTGARYNPAADSWTVTATAPFALERHAAVWAGDVMIVSGGFNGTVDVASTVSYNPVSNSWTTFGAMVTTRSDHRMVWTGKYVYALGGASAGIYHASVERFTLPAGTWSTMSSFITGRSKFIAVYNGKDKIYLYGGESAGPAYRSDLQSALINPDGTLGTWTNLSTAVTARAEHVGVWTGTDLLVYGGKNASALFTGGERFNQATGLWTNMTTVNQPSLRFASAAVWTGKEMIVWGGFCELNACMVNTGARYNPQSNVWAPTATVMNPLKGREQMSVVWTGTQGIIWGGTYTDSVGVQYLNSGGKYTPATNSWTPTGTIGAPTGRYAHSGVWTGTYMVILTGSDALALNTGGRYEPAADTWTATPAGGGGPTAGPSARYQATAVWDAASARVLYHGGYDGVSYMDTGKKYDPAANAWSVMAASGVLRAQHSAVWTGTEMVVFGGTGGVPLSSGGRYNPTGDSWVALAAGPSARTLHTAVWTGSDMIVFGGWDGAAALGDGAVWNGATQTWTATITNSPLSARRYHTAVWTGSQMLVYGGFALSTSNGFADGAAYTYPGNTWTTMSANRYTPFGRGIHVAFWTGQEMVVFGGGHGAHLSSGGRYQP